MQKRQKIRRGLILISFLLFPITIYYFSPVLPIMGGYSGIIAGSLISFTVMFTASLFIGRLFCGWICPAAGLQEACFVVNDSQIKKGNWVKYLIWFPWLAAIVILLAISKGNIKVDPLYQTWLGISLHNPQSYFVFFGFLALIVILSFTVGKRSFCHHVCWMAPFMVAGRKLQTILKLPALKLVAVEDNCTSCKLCSKHCPMSLDVEELVHNKTMENSECILCGMCADICKKKVIRYSFSRK